MTPRRRAAPAVGNGAPAASLRDAAPPSSALERVALLLAPAGTAAVRADETWSLPSGRRSEPAGVWGREPAASGGGLASTARAAIARERAIRALARRHTVAVHRWPPQHLRAGTIRRVARSALLGGVVVELAPPGSGRPLDRVAEAAGATGPVTGLRVSPAGAAVCRLRRPDGSEVLLRAAGAGWPGDPAHAAGALARLATEPLPVPRPLGEGRLAGISWATETVLPGRRPARLSPGILAGVAALWTRLPRSDAAPASVGDDLDTLARFLPDRAEQLARAAAAVRARAGRLPGILRHGDLWTGNLLTAGERVLGIVDWDGWHPAGVPGADLLHLYATDRRIRARCEMGAMWLRRPWLDRGFLEATGPYWETLGLAPDADLLETAAVAWWAAETSGTLSRVSQRAADAAWVGANVDAVLDAIL